MQRILIVGATSAIAEATARRFAARGDALFLVGRNAARLDEIAADLRVRGAARVGCQVMDATDTAAHAAMLAAAEALLDAFDVALIAHGTLPDQRACEASVELTLREIDNNGLSVIALATQLANLLMLAVHCEDAAQRLLVPKADTPIAPRLSQRELKVLRWAMAGKSAWDAGMVLGISERTANFHIQAETRKLDCRNKHQAVLPALRLGLIG